MTVYIGNIIVSPVINDLKPKEIVFLMKMKLNQGIIWWITLSAQDFSKQEEEEEEEYQEEGGDQV